MVQRGTLCRTWKGPIRVDLCITSRTTFFDFVCFIWRELKSLDWFKKCRVKGRFLPYLLCTSCSHHVWYIPGGMLSIDAKMSFKKNRPIIFVKWSRVSVISFVYPKNRSRNGCRTPSEKHAALMVCSLRP